MGRKSGFPFFDLCRASGEHTRHIFDLCYARIGDVRAAPTEPSSNISISQHLYLQHSISAPSFGKARPNILSREFFRQKPGRGEQSDSRNRARILLGVAGKIAICGPPEPKSSRKFHATLDHAPPPNTHPTPSAPANWPGAGAVPWTTCGGRRNLAASMSRSTEVEKVGVVGVGYSAGKLKLK